MNKIRFNPKRFKIRTGIYLSLGLIVFFSFLLIKLIIPDLNKTEEDYLKKTSIIVSTREIFVPKNNLEKKEKRLDAIVIELKDKNYSIWLTDYSEKKAWRLVHNENNYNKQTDYYFIDRLLQGNRLYNPNKLIIDGKEILSSERDKIAVKISFYFILTLILISGFVFYGCIMTYKEKLAIQDKKNWTIKNKKSKLKVIRKWMIE